MYQQAAALTGRVDSLSSSSSILIQRLYNVASRTSLGGKMGVGGGVGGGGGGGEGAGGEKERRVVGK